MITTTLAENVPPNVIEILAKTNDNIEIWWDSSPLIFANWAQELLDNEPDPQAKAILKVQLQRLYNHDQPANCLFAGVATNPPLSKQAIDQARQQWDPWVDELIKQRPKATKQELFWHIYTEVIKRGAAMFQPKFAASGYKRGYLSGQVDPRILQDTDEMVRQGVRINKMSPNIMVKMPGTKEGIEGIRILTSLGIPTNATLVFTVPQMLTAAEAVKAGLVEGQAKGADFTKWRSVVTMMLGRFEDAKEFQRQAAALCIELTDQDKRWAGIAIFKKVYRIFKQRGYPSKPLAASMRLGPTINNKQRIWHIEKLAGGAVVLTIFPNILAAFMQNYTPEEIIPRMDEDIPTPVLKKLLKIDYFAQGYAEDGLKPEEFINHPAVIETANSFAKATYELEDYAAARMV